MKFVRSIRPNVIPVIDQFSGEYRFLSNFWATMIEYQWLTFKTTEHAFQWAKMATQVDKEAVRFAKTPGDAKREARKRTMRANWDQIKDGVMLELQRIKYDSQHPALREKLIGTHPARLIEGNTWNDTYWGVCNGVGKNRLGEILMQVREEIRG